MINNLIQTLENFWAYRDTKKLDIYNEFSLQFELGIYLRNIYHPKYKVEFERNVRYFISPHHTTTKHEIDLVIYDNNKKEKYAIELKCPKNGKIPENMFSFIEDIKFCEELKNLGFNNTYVMTMVDDCTYYSNKNKRNLTTSGIYSYFRGNTTIQGNVSKPTGNNNTSIKINNSYNISWKHTNNNYNNQEMYYLIEI